MTTISREAQAIIDFVESTGLPYRVTDVNGPGHTPSSYHYAEGIGGTGTAVDFAGTVPGVTPATVSQMTAIHHAFLAVAPRLAELIFCSADTATAVLDGRRVDGLTAYGATTWAAHRNHVHVAVRRGVFLVPVTPPPYHEPEVPVPDDPTVPNAQAKIVAAFPTPTGKGYTIITADGAVFAFGDAGYYGRVEAPT